MLITIGKNNTAVQLDKIDHDKFFVEGFGFYIGTDGYLYRRKYLGYKNGKNIEERIALHRLIMNAPKGMEVDHINRDRLDNRRENLRVCSKTENRRNSPGRNGFKGVSFDKVNKKWRSRISSGKESHWLGRFETPEAAALAYNKAVKSFHGDYALLNIIKN